MNGLFIKDLKLLRTQRKFLLMVGVFSIYFMLTMENTSAIIAYLAMLSCIVLISTISYDEFDNGYAFLFTLPCSRKEYAVEKYIFSLLMIFGICCISIVLSVLGAYINGTDLTIADAVFAGALIFAAALVMMSLLIPIELRFGSEKSRIVLCVCIIAVVAVGFVGQSLLDGMNIRLDAFFGNIMSLRQETAAVIALLIGFAIMLVSLLVSIRIVEKKEL